MSVIDTIKDKALFIFGLDSGCRVSEVSGVRFTDIDWEKQIVRVWDEKKDKPREVIVSKTTLLNIKMAIAETPIKKRMDIFPFCERTLNRKLKKWAAKAGIKPERAHWHALRHTHVIRSRLMGRDMKQIQAQTGDSELTLLRIYSELTPEERKDIVNQKPIIPEVDECPK